MSRLRPIVENYTVTTKDGRKLAVQRTGDPNGEDIFLEHGTPGSAKAPLPRPVNIWRYGVNLITYNRPGYGDSDPHPGRRVVDSARNVAAIADTLDIEEFSIAGRSGGGAHALACDLPADNRLPLQSYNR